MRRRYFMRLAALLGLGAAVQPTWAARSRSAADDAAAPVDDSAIDPYFLDPGDVGASEKKTIEKFIDYQELMADGKPAILPRGGRPKRAPTFRLLRWKGDPGDPEGRFVGPLSSKPTLPQAGGYMFNAQILGFNASSLDWRGKRGRGTLTVEFRALAGGEALTWFYIEQFEVAEGGSTTIGLQYVAQRDGSPFPVLTDEPNVDVRVQLMRHRKSPGVFRKILKVGSYLVGAPLLGGGSGKTGALDELMGSMEGAPPLLRVPRLTQEGVAFSQALVGNMADEKPVWRGGFTTYSIAEGGSRLSLTPGLWVVMDDDRETDLRGVVLDDMGGHLGLTRDQEPLDINYLVLAVEARVEEQIFETEPRGVTPKGGPA